MNTKAPQYQLKRVFDDGSESAPELVPVTELPWEVRMQRRGFLGAGLTTAAVLGLLARNGLAGSFQKLSNVSTVFAHADNINSVAFSPSGKLMASGSVDGTIKLWSIPDGRLLYTLTGQYVNSVSFSPNGKLLASGNRDKTIKLWSTPNGELVNTLAGHKKWVTSVAFSPDSKLLASGSQDKSIKLWSMSDGKLLNTLGDYDEGVNSVAFSPDEAYEIMRKKQLLDWDVNSVAFSPDGNLLASGNRNNSIKLWSMPEGKLLKRLTGHNASVGSVSFSPEGKLLASGSSDNSIKLWTMPEGKLLKTLSGHEKWIPSIAFSSDGKLLASGSGDESIKLWSMPDGKLLETLAGHDQPVYSVAFSPDGNLLVSGSWDKTIRLWDLQKREFRTFLFDPAANQMDAITYNRKDSETGLTLTHTQPCGSSIPAGAVCTCNCVPGSIANSPSRTSGRTICTCNKVCTCVPICQAHYMLHPNSAVRTMAAELLILMGETEFAYMNWAADTSDFETSERIYSVMQAIRSGLRPAPYRWPTVSEIKPFLMHEDKVIRIMSAQMLYNHHAVYGKQLSNCESRHVRSLLAAAQNIHREKMSNWTTTL